MNPWFQTQISGGLALTLLFSLCTIPVSLAHADEVKVTRDGKGNPTREERYDKKGKLTGSTDYERNAKGKVTKKTSTSVDQNGKPTTVQVTEYDDEGREGVITHEIYGADGKVKVKIRQTTTYKDKDDHSGTPKHEIWDPEKKKWVPWVQGKVGMVRPAYGLLTTTFTTAAGKIVVNLPDDLAAGDTISGTVIAEPSGKDNEEKAANQGELNGYVVEAVPAGQSESGELTGQVLEHPRTSARDRRLRWTIPAAGVGVAMLVLRDRAGKVVDRAPVSCPLHPATAPSELQLPHTTVAGKPLVIQGPFDGNASNTQARLEGQVSEVLAESAQKCIVQPPFTGTGPAKLEVEENGKSASGICRVLGIRMSASKAILERGESGPVNIIVLGLEGLEKPTSFVLVNRTPGMVSLSGGDWQRVAIAPSQVQEGQYRHTLTMTAVRPGRYLLQAGIPGAFPDGPLQINNEGEGQGVEDLPLARKIKDKLERDQLIRERSLARKAEEKAREAREKADKAKGTDASSARAEAEAAEKAAKAARKAADALRDKTSRQALIDTYDAEEKSFRKSADEAKERGKNARAKEKEYGDEAKKHESFLRESYEEKANLQRRFAEADEAEQKAMEKQANEAHKELERAKLRTITR